MQSLVRLSIPFVRAHSTCKCLLGLHGKLGAVFLLEHCDSIKVLPFTFSLVHAMQSGLPATSVFRCSMSRVWDKATIENSVVDIQYGLYRADVRTLVELGTEV